MTEPERAGSTLPLMEPSAAMLLILAARQVEQKVETALAPLGLTVRKLGVLGHLRRDPGLSFSELARRSSITVQSMHVVVQSLLHDGLVETEHVEGQGRASRILLTPLGTSRLVAALSAIKSLDASLFDDASDRTALIGALLAILGGLPGGQPG